MKFKIIIECIICIIIALIPWFISALNSGWFYKNGKLNKLFLIFSCIYSCCVIAYAYLHISREFENLKKLEITEEEKQSFSPKLDIKLFPSSDKAVTPYQYPLERYILMIQNSNNNSTPILDFRIEFNFKNIITEVKPMPLLNTGGNITVSGVRIYRQKKDGSFFTYEEQPVKTALTKNFSLEIQQVKINQKDVNTNIVIFSCSRWPEEAVFSADIIVDLSEKTEIQKTPEKLGTYEGIYFYEIKGKKFSEKINGIIPNAEDDKKQHDTKGAINIDADSIIKEMGVLINDVLDTELFRKEWNIIENNFNANIHPFVRDAFIAHKQIQNIIENKSTGTTPEILAFGKIAFYINLLKRFSTEGIDKQLNLFFSCDYKTYLPARYALQIAGSLKNRGHQVTFIYNKESENSSIILISNGESKAEILCVHLDIENKQTNYITEIFKNIQDIKKLLSKTYPGLIMIEIDEKHYLEYEKGNQILEEQIKSIMQNDNSVSAILLTCNIFIEDRNNFIYRTAVLGFRNETAMYKIPDWLERNFITQKVSDP